MPRAKILAVVGVLAVGIAACSSPADQPDVATGATATTTNVEPSDSASQVEESAGASPASESVTTTTEVAVDEVEIPPFIPHPEPADIQRCEVPQPGWAKLQGGNDQYFSQIGFPIDQQNLTSLGELTVTAIPVDFESTPGTEDDIAKFAEQLENFTQYFDTVSGGQLSVTVNMTGTWQRLGGAPADFAQEQFVGPNSRLAQTAIDAVDADVDFSTTDLVILTFPPGVTIPATNGGEVKWIEAAATEWRLTPPVADGVEVPNYLLAGPQYWSMSNAWKLYVKGLSLMMGLPELYGGSLYDVDGLDVPGEEQGNAGPFSNWALLSWEQGISTNLPAWSRWTMGWIDPAEVLCFDLDSLEGQTFDLELLPLDADGNGYRTLIIRTGPEAGLIFESRRAEGLDAGLSEWSRSGRDPNGVLGYTLDTLKISRRGPLTPVVPEGRGLVNVGRSNTVDALLNEGDHVTYGGVTFTLLESGDADRLRVSAPAGTDVGVTAPTYPLPSGTYDATLVAAPDEAAAEVCQIPQAPGVRTGGQGATGFPVEFRNLRPDGEVNIVTIPLDWDNYEGDPADLDAAHDEVSLSLDYFERVSEGKLTFNRNYQMKWFRLPEPVEAYPQDQVSDFNPKLAQAGIDAADPEVDFTEIDMVLFIFPRSAPILAGRPQSPYEFASLQHFNNPPSVNVTSDEGRIINYFGGGIAQENPRNPLWSYYNHELSHAFATPDWYVNAGQALYGSRDLTPDESVRIGPLNTWGTMSSNGGISKIFVAWTRMLMGWLEQDQIECYTLDQLAEAGPFDVELTPLEIYEPGTKAVVIRTGQYSGVLIESRRPIFPDHGLEIWETVGRDPYGLIAYEIDTTIEHGEGALTLILPDGQGWAPIEWHGRHDQESKDGLFNVGAVGSSQGVSIELLHSGDRDIVRIGPASE